MSFVPPTSHFIKTPEGGDIGDKGGKGGGSRIPRNRSVVVCGLLSKIMTCFGIGVQIAHFLSVSVCHLSLSSRRQSISLCLPVIWSVAAPKLPLSSSRTADVPADKECYG